MPYLQLGATVVLFGLSWPLIKIGLSASTPVWLAAGRATCSALAAYERARSDRNRY